MLAEGRIARHLNWQHARRPADDLIRKCIVWAWKVKLGPSLERELFAKARETAEQVAIKVFAENLRDLLLAAPAGPRVVMGLDPGIRTGCKVAVVDATGKVLATDTVYPLEPRRDREGALRMLAALCTSHRVSLLAIGNGTASRETDALAAELIERPAAVAPDTSTGDPAAAPALQKVVVSEAGASVFGTTALVGPGRGIGDGRCVRPRARQTLAGPTRAPSAPSSAAAHEQDFFAALHPTRNPQRTGSQTLNPVALSTRSRRLPGTSGQADRGHSPLDRLLIINASERTTT